MIMQDNLRHGVILSSRYTLLPLQSLPHSLGGGFVQFRFTILDMLPHSDDQFPTATTDQPPFTAGDQKPRYTHHEQGVEILTTADRIEFALVFISLAVIYAAAYGSFACSRLDSNGAAARRRPRVKRPRAPRAVCRYKTR